MIKKNFFAILSLSILIILSGCPDKDKSKNDESEKIPNSMEKASTELEEIITLLGGPMFDSRDKIEKLKNEQIQMLSEKAGERPEKITTGTQNMRQDEKSDAEQGSGNQEEHGQQGSQGNGEQSKEDSGDQKKEAGGDQKKEAGNSEEKGAEGDEKEPGKEQGKEGEQAGGEKQKSSEEEQTGGPGNEQKTPSESEENKPFHFEDSLFGIPQWNEENWKLIKVLADGMYFTWNDLFPSLLEKGVTQAQGESFGASLESLSKAVREKNIGNAQTSAFELFDKLSEFYSYFKTDKPAEMQRITSMVTGIHFSVRQNDWNQAQKLSNDLQKEFAKMKANIQDNQSEAVKMLEISLDDLRSAVQKQDAMLVLIRTNLVTSNIEELDAKLSQQQSE